MVCQLPESVTGALRDEWQEFLRVRKDVGPADIAQYVNLAESTVRNWLAGSMNGGNEVIAEMRRALDQARAGDILRPKGSDAVVITEDPTKRVRKLARAGKFYVTQTGQKIGEVLDYCAENCAIGVVVADFGVGKTEAVREWRRKHAGKVESVVFEFDEFSSTNKVDTVRMMARAFGVGHAVGSVNGGLVFRDICEYLRQHPCLLIFDQCETLRPRVCQVLRQIWDRTNDAGVGLVMLAAPILMQRLMGGKMVDLGALTSRVGVWAPLQGITRAEMRFIVGDAGFPEVDDAAMDLWYKATAGSMRRLMRSLDLLSSKHKGKRVTEKTITQVAGMLWGMSMATGEI